jgi:hypothetical protein
MRVKEVNSQQLVQALCDLADSDPTQVFYISVRKSDQDGRKIFSLPDGTYKLRQ